MNIRFDIHTHTLYSHGKGTVFDNFNVAREKKLMLGIADHGPGHMFYGVREKGMSAMKMDIEQIRNENPQAVLLQGIEANLMDSKGLCDIDLLSMPQYVLMGYHKGVFPKSMLSVSLFSTNVFSKNRAAQIHTDALIAAIERYPIIAITHPGEYIPVDMKRLSTECAKNGVLLELNNKHPMNTNDLIAAKESDASFLLSSDAHQSIHVGQVENASTLAEQVGIPQERIVNSVSFIADNISENKLRILKLRDLFFPQLNG